jgi:ubiquinone/menaquinone biosynthesis C-methylase UbiE
MFYNRTGLTFGRKHLNQVIWKFTFHCGFSAKKVNRCPKTRFNAVWRAVRMLYTDLIGGIEMQVESHRLKVGVDSLQRLVRCEEPSLASPHLRVVQTHYRDTIDDYKQWSPEGNLHFGYWRWGINPFSRRSMLEEMNNQVFKHLRLKELQIGSIADLGCGVGAVSRFGGCRFPNLQWLAMNISSRQIEEALAMHRDENIEYYCSDYHQLPWEDCSIDGAFFVESLCYSLQPQDVIAEVARVLRPGSRLVITDGFLMRPLPETSRLFRAIFKRVANNWAVPSYHLFSDVDSWLAKSGLQRVECYDLSWRLAPTAFQSIPLTLFCALKLCCQLERNPWRWRQLAASSLSLSLGLQRSNFKYFLIVLEKPLTP